MRALSAKDEDAISIPKSGVGVMRSIIAELYCLALYPIDSYIRFS
jgi:hypothetical protein